MRTIIVIAFVTLTEAFLSCSDFCKLHGFKQIEGAVMCLCVIEDIVENQHFGYSSRIIGPVEEYYPDKKTIYMEPLNFRSPFYPSQLNKNQPILENLKRPNKPSSFNLNNNNHLRKHESSIHPLNTKNKRVPFYLDIGIDETISNSRFGGSVTIDDPQVLEQDLIDCINLHILIEIREGNVDSNKSIRSNQHIHKYFDFSDSQLKLAIQNKCTQPVEIIKASLEEIKNKTPRRTFDSFSHSEQETKSNLIYINDADAHIKSGKKTDLKFAGYNVAKKIQSIGKDTGITTSHIAPLTELNNLVKKTLSHYENTVTPSTKTQEGIWTKMSTNQDGNDDSLLYTKTFDNETTAFGTTLTKFKEITNFTETKLNPTDTVTPSTITQEGIWTKMSTNQAGKDDSLLHTKTFETTSSRTTISKFKEITNFTETKLKSTDTVTPSTITQEGIWTKMSTNQAGKDESLLHTKAFETTSSGTTISKFKEVTNFTETKLNPTDTVTPSTITQEGIWTKMSINQAGKDDSLLYTKTFDNETTSLGTTLPKFKVITNFTETKLNPTEIENLTTLTTPNLVNIANTTSSLSSDLVIHGVKELKSDNEIINLTFDINNATKSNNNDSVITTETILDISSPYEQTEKSISFNDTERYVDIFPKNNTELINNPNTPPLFSVSDSIETDEYPITTEKKSNHLHQDEFLVHNLIKLENTITTRKTTDLGEIYITKHSTSNKSVEKIISTLTPSKYDELVDNEDHKSLLFRGVTVNTSPLEPSMVIRENQADADLIEDRSFTTTRYSELEPNLLSKILNNENRMFETKSTTRRTKLELVKQTINGELNFLFRGFSIPARFFQNSGGKIQVGIDGENLCDKIIENGLNDSIIISVLCKCLKTNNCNDSLFTDNN